MAGERVDHKQAAEDLLARAAQLHQADRIYTVHALTLRAGVHATLALQERVAEVGEILETKTISVMDAGKV